MWAASQNYKVPYSTLSTRVKGVYDMDVTRGPSSVFSKEEEKDIVTWIFNMSRCGFPIDKQHLLDTIQNIVQKTDRKTPFTDGRPSKHWYSAFLRRNPELSERMSQNLTKARSEVSRKSFEDWYTEVGGYLEEKNLKDIDPSSVFNLDESAFMLCAKSGRVLVSKGIKSVYNVCKSDKECYTALIGGNAAGTLLPPMILYSYERIPKTIANNFPNSFIIGKSDTGWMTSSTFYSYIVNHFHPWCIKENIPFPGIIYVDGHSSHLTKALSDYCCDNQIELIGLVPNATHLHQPIDVGLFHVLKNAYKNRLREWRQNHDGQYPTKVFFPTVLEKALSDLDLKEILKNSFEKCGLHPFNHNSIDYSKLIPYDPVRIISNDQNHDEPSPTVSSPHQLSHNIESMIKPDVLKMFKENVSPDWKGSIEYKKLFVVWRQCINQSSNKVRGAEPLCTSNINCQSSVNTGCQLHKNGSFEVTVTNNTVTSQVPEEIVSELVQDGIVETVQLIEHHLDVDNSCTPNNVESSSLNNRFDNSLSLRNQSILRDLHNIDHSQKDEYHENDGGSPLNLSVPHKNERAFPEPGDFQNLFSITQG
ncbi:uncharacterized protein LOC109862703 isoform X2 [Pseudomyrmex gracilis]|nr:uncharacterized protein LOC109862703 isoform X2 [Pseudomyrmex gracilis]